MKTPNAIHNEERFGETSRDTHINNEKFEVKMLRSFKSRVCMLERNIGE